MVHLLNEQPIMVDLFGLPTASDITLVCTNVRGLTGQRPVWADNTDSLFYFPWTQIRFLEVAPERGAPRRASTRSTAMPMPPPEDDLDEELDEDFLRKVREA